MPRLNRIPERRPPPRQPERDDRPYAPPLVHPDDIPYDPDADARWCRDRGLPPRSGDDKKQGPNRGWDPDVGKDFEVNFELGKEDKE